MSKEYLQPCPLSVIRDLIQCWGQSGKPFDKKKAAQSLLLDVLSGVDPESDRSQREYADFWNRSPSWVSRNLDEIRNLAESYRTFYGEEGRNTDETPSQSDETPSQFESASEAAEGRKLKGDETPSQDNEMLSQDDETPTQQSDKTYKTDSLDKSESETSSSGAGTREEGDESEQTTVEERFEKLVTIWRQTSGTPPLNAKREETFYRWADDRVITEWDTYRKVLRREAEITQERDVNLALAYLREEYEDEVESGVLSPERQEDPNWTVENGEKHFKGVPLSEIGCKNYYTGETA